MKTINFNSSKLDFLNLIKDFKNYTTSDSCKNNKVKSLIEGKFDKEGWYGKVLIDKGKAYKMNVGTIGNHVKGKLFFLNRVLHQNVMLIIVHSIIEKNKPSIIYRYPKVYDVFKCGKSYISVYNAFNKGNLKDLIYDIKDPKILDVELLRCIFQISEIVGFLSTNYNFMHNDLKIDNIMAHKDKKINYKMIDLDMSYIELKKLTLISDIGRYSNDKNLIHKINISDDNIYAKIEPIGIQGFEKEGDTFRFSYRKYINVDMYILFISIIFEDRIIKIINKLPMFNTFLSFIFTESDIDKIRATIHGEYALIPKPIIGYYNYIIMKEISLRLDIFDYIKSTIKNIEKEFDEKLSI